MATVNKFITNQHSKVIQLRYINKVTLCILILILKITTDKKQSPFGSIIINKNAATTNYLN